MPSIFILTFGSAIHSSCPSQSIPFCIFVFFRVVVPMSCCSSCLKPSVFPGTSHQATCLRPSWHPACYLLFLHTQYDPPTLSPSLYPLHPQPLFALLHVCITMTTVCIPNKSLGCSLISAGLLPLLLENYLTVWNKEYHLLSLGHRYGYCLPYSSCVRVTMVTRCNSWTTLVTVSQTPFFHHGFCLFPDSVLMCLPFHWAWDTLPQPTVRAWYPLSRFSYCIDELHAVTIDKIIHFSFSVSLW